MKTKLPDSVASIQDLHSLIDELKNYLTWLNHEETKKQFNAKKTSPEPLVSAEATQFLRSLNSTGSLSAIHIQEAVTFLEKYAKNALSINVVLAAPAPNSVKNSIVNWCRKNIDDGIIVNFQFNRNILGGIVIRFGSRIFDWSFRRKIITNRSKILEALNNVR